MLLAVEQNSIEPIKPLSQYKFKPVGIREFIESDYYLGKKNDIYPILLEELVILNSGLYEEAVFTGGIGAGKCLGKDTPVIMYNGTVKPVQDIVAGDTLMGVDSLPRSVIGTTTGKDTLYKVSQKGGEDYVVNSQHILSLQYTDTSNKKGTKVINRYSRLKGDILNISIKDYLSLSTRHRNLLKGWRPKVVNFLSEEVYDPYLLGLWLGDGTSACAHITSMDAEIVGYLEDVAAREGTLLTIGDYPKGSKAKRYSFSMGNIGGAKGSNPILTWLQDLNVLNNKHIPKKYLNSSEKDRLSLLAGIIDTDGSLHNGYFDLTLVNKQLFDDVCFLSNSLGFQVNKSIRIIKGKPYYRMTICGDINRVPTLLERKKAEPRTQIKSWSRWSITVTEIGLGDYYGFELEGTDKLFLLGDFTVTHNSTGALYTQLYQMYLLSCMKNPHASFGLDPSSEIVIAFQSINFTIAKRGDYGRFKHMVEMSPYFTEHFPFDNSIESRLLFPHRIEVLPISGLETAAIGQNIISAVLEEVNFMAVTTQSKKSIDGNEFDQAAKLYNSISKRRESRFLSAGNLPGILCIVSSKRYPGQFTDTKEAEAVKQLKETGKSKIYVYDKRIWDVKPTSYSGVTFDIFIGDEGRQPRILELEELVHPKDRNLIDHIPIELKHHFERDIITSLRDLAGRSTLATHPFIMNTEAITRCMDRNDSIFSKDSVDFVEDGLEIYPENFYRTDLPRYAHIDLGLTGDSAGLTIGTVTGFERVIRSDKESGEMLPNYYIDGTLEIRPPKGGEILFWKIRNTLYALRDSGLNIRWVSLDTFQSRDTMQILKQKGFFTGILSMDVSMLPYEVTKYALYDDRVTMPFHEKLRKELASLEVDAKKAKIDHPPQGSKDLSDSLAGVIGGLISRREVWGHFGIPPTEIPESVKYVVKDSKDTEKVDSRPSGTRFTDGTSYD
jgi:hypothetical protein